MSSYRSSSIQPLFNVENCWKLTLTFYYSLLIHYQIIFFIGQATQIMWAPFNMIVGSKRHYWLIWISSSSTLCKTAANAANTATASSAESYWVYSQTAVNAASAGAEGLGGCACLPLNCFNCGKCCLQQMLQVRRSLGMGTDQGGLSRTASSAETYWVYSRTVVNAATAFE